MHREQGQYDWPILPQGRCPWDSGHLPSVILGSLTYRRHPVPLDIYDIRAFHTDLFAALALLEQHRGRAPRFMEYMAVHFCLDHLEGAGLEPDRRRRQPANANYLRMARGWSFDSDGREGAVLKSWSETRSGLLPRQHTGPLGDRDSKARHTYMRQAAVGISTV